jgi:UDP-N-acetylglucosamine 2-epimerase
MKIVTVVGARPQFIKAAPVSRELQSAGVQELLVHTGQHYDREMSDIFFAELALPRPAFHLKVGSDKHGTQTGAMLQALEPILLAERPDMVLVYGDTNSTLAGALAAAKLGIPVAHVEAGLRSFDRSMPEEINRVLTDRLAQWLFAPTRAAVTNLAREGMAENVHLVGDVLFDALRHFAPDRYAPVPLLEKLGLDDRAYVLATLHRAGNTDDAQRFVHLWQALLNLSRDFPVLFPIHPRTRKVMEHLDLEHSAALHVIEAVGYPQMLQLESHARLIVTDSGGVQREAFWFAVPCLTLRDETEWVETVAAGWNRLVGADAGQLIAAARGYWNSPPSAAPPTVFGTGYASKRIVQLVQSEGRRERRAG